MRTMKRKKELFRHFKNRIKRGDPSPRDPISKAMLCIWKLLGQLLRSLGKKREDKNDFENYFNVSCR